MLEDKQLAEALTEAEKLERMFRAEMEGTRDVNERALAEVAMRQATATRRSVERWIATRVRLRTGVGTT